jgi:1-acyl-sn-glycerol-3-phosphate acyltransferase
MLEKFLASAFCGSIKLITGVCALWQENPPEASARVPRVYYANHRSHGDFVLIWACLPPLLRAQTRPVAAADYWLRGAFRRYLIERVFRGVLIDRHVTRGNDPIAVMAAPLAAGESLILFPEGTRNPNDELLPFKSGMHHLAQAHAETEFVPVWIENLGRAMPKGGLIPIPLLCTLTFGAPLTLSPGESRANFIARCRAALLALEASGD